MERKEEKGGGSEGQKTVKKRRWKTWRSRNENRKEKRQFQRERERPAAGAGAGAGAGVAGAGELTTADF